MKTTCFFLFAMLAAGFAAAADTTTTAAPAPAPGAAAAEENLTLPRVLSPVAYALYNDSGLQQTIAECATALTADPSEFLFETLVETLDWFEKLGYCKMPADELYKELRARLHYGFSIATKAALLVGYNTAGGAPSPARSVPAQCYKNNLAVDQAVNEMWATLYEGAAFCTAETLDADDRVTLRRPAPIEAEVVINPQQRGSDYTVRSTDAAGRKLML